MTSEDPASEELFLRIEFVPHSLKNRQRIFKIGKRTVIKCSKEADMDAKSLASIVHEVWPHLHNPRWPTQSMRLNIRHIVPDDAVEITVSPIRERPKGKTGRKRDIHNIVDIIADALQVSRKTGIGVVQNDNQFSDVHITRVDENGEIL